VRKHVVGVVIPGASPGPAPKGEGRVRRPSRPSSGKGKAPGREKPRRARRPPDRGDTDAASQPAWGTNPCSEAVTDPPSVTAAIANGGTRDPEIAPRAEAERRRGTDAGPGRCVPPIGSARFGSARPHGQSQEGMRRREAHAIHARSSSEGKTPRARPDETSRGDRDGSKASRPVGTAGTQQDPEEATPGVVARRDWVAPRGNKPRESR